MPNVVVDFKVPAAPVSSLLKRMERGIEHFYYAELFAKSDAYDQSPVWKEWLERGFNIAIVSPPQETRREDRVHLSMGGLSTANPILTVDGPNADALKDLLALLETIETIRPSLAGKSDDERVAVGLKAGPVADQLFNPVMAALARNGIDEEGVAQFTTMLRRAFVAITDHHVQSIVLS